MFFNLLLQISWTDNWFAIWWKECYFLSNKTNGSINSGYSPRWWHCLTCEIKDRINGNLEHRYIDMVVQKSACSWANVLFLIQDKYKWRRECNVKLQYPVLDIDESPLQWWNLKTSRMPLLSSVACKYLSVCATSMPSKWVLNIGGNVVQNKQSHTRSTI